VFAANGRMLLRRAIDPLKTGGPIALERAALPAGGYVLIHYADGREQCMPAAFITTDR
jgi:hypothetical protein